LLRGKNRASRIVRILIEIFKALTAKVILIGDGAGWIVDNICICLRKEISKIEKATFVVHPKVVFFPFIRNKKIIYVNRMGYLDRKNGSYILKLATRNNLYAFWWHSAYGGNNRELISNFERLKKIEIAFKKILVSCSIEVDVLLGNGFPKEKIAIIPLGVETDIFKPLSNHQKSELRKKFHIGRNTFCIGSFQKDGVGWNEGSIPKLEKGPDVLVKVMERIWRKNKEILVVLTGAARGYVKKRLTELRIPFIYSYVDDYHELVKYYNLLDVYLITSRTEGGPSSLLEAMACGVSVVSTRVGMAADVIEDGVNGYLAEIEDVDQLVGKVEILMNNPDIKEKFAVNGINSVQKYSWERIAKQYLPLMD
jgi:glycosyltransferase involved in cell wall biosynthesis